MNIFTKRNALVGYLALKAHSQARRRWGRRRNRRSGWKLATLVVLGVLSVGVLAAIVIVAFRRPRDEQAQESVEADGAAAAIEPVEDAFPAAASEPIAAT